MNGDRSGQRVRAIPVEVSENACLSVRAHLVVADIPRPDDDRVARIDVHRRLVAGVPLVVHGVVVQVVRAGHLDRARHLDLQGFRSCVAVPASRQSRVIAPVAPLVGALVCGSWSPRGHVGIAVEPWATGREIRIHRERADARLEPSEMVESVPGARSTCARIRRLRVWHNLAACQKDRCVWLWARISRSPARASSACSKRRGSRSSASPPTRPT